ncbi:hypothetical protein VKT23_015256 [Stygiomarasmius scandens]|uniref:Ribonuclease H1 N-terminal domain-containing protein n=1 Tax=Marasmiellus scandens TaxID=2682957 RepID=A0ABR1J310_9AGAR
MMDEEEAAFKIPPGSRVTISYPDADGNFSGKEYKVTLPPGQFLNVLAAPPSRHTRPPGNVQQNNIGSLASAPSAPRTPRAPRTIPAVKFPASPLTQGSSTTSAGHSAFSATTVPCSSPATSMPVSRPCATVPVLRPPASPTKVLAQGITGSPCYYVSDLDSDSDGSDDYGSYFLDVDIPESILGKSDPDTPVWKYRVFAHLAHPDELLWDDSCGGTNIYVITRGRCIGILADWKLVQELTQGVSNACQRSCRNIDQAIALYTAAYDNVAGHVPLAVVATKNLEGLISPVIDDRKKSVRGYDIDLQVYGDPLNYHASPISQKNVRQLVSPKSKKLASQALSPASQTSSQPGPSRLQ